MGWTQRACATLAALSILAACGGDDQARRETVVYVAGWERNAAGVQVAKLWKDRVPTDLSDGLRAAQATGVFVDGEDVYVSGGIGGEVHDAAAYWRNGELVQLTGGLTQAFASAVTVADGEVLVAGYEVVDGQPLATLWRDGAPSRLGQGRSDALAVTVSAGEVYVSGYEYAAVEVEPGTVWIRPVAKLWRNGVGTALSGTLQGGVARAVMVSGADVYAAGFVDDGAGKVAVSWKNGLPTQLNDGVFGALATGVALDGGEVLVSGAAYDGVVDVARVWRGGVPTDLTSYTAQGEGEHSVAWGIAVSAGDVHAAGHRGFAATYWKNGTPANLTDGKREAEAHGIAVTVR